MQQLEFEWDPAKNEANLAKHGIAFADAIGIFHGVVVRRRSHRQGEERWIAVGLLAGREIAVVYTEREARYRIISARRAREHEREEYRRATSGG